MSQNKLISLFHITPFGSAINTRSYVASTKYRYGFNNQEKDEEIGDCYAFEYRIHDARLGRFLSVDPLRVEYPWNSTYAFAENRVIDGIDLEGLEYRNATQSEIDNFKKNGNGTLKEGEVGYLYQVGADKYSVWVGVNQYEKDANGFCMLNRKITYDTYNDVYCSPGPGSTSTYSTIQSTFINLDDKGKSTSYSILGNAPSHLIIAWSYFGINETDNKDLVKGMLENHNENYYKTDNKGNKTYSVGTDPTSNNNPWCGVFVLNCFTEAGKTIDKKAGGYNPSYSGFWQSASWGNCTKVDAPQAGDIVRFSFHHVAIVLKVEGDYIYYIGGNQGPADKDEDGRGGMVSVKKAKISGLSDGIYRINN